MLEVAAQRLRAEFDIAELVLFGSVAGGEASEDSDVDLLVVLKSEATHTQRNAVFSAIFRINLELGSDVAALVVSEEDWKQGLLSISSLRQEVERDGAWLA